MCLIFMHACNSAWCINTIAVVREITLSIGDLFTVKRMSSSQQVKAFNCEELADWLKEKGFESDVQKVFKGNYLTISFQKCIYADS